MINAVRGMVTLSSWRGSQCGYVSSVGGTVKAMAKANVRFVAAHLIGVFSSYDGPLRVLLAYLDSCCR